MILVLGASGYIGEAFIQELKHRGWRHEGLSRKSLDYTQYDFLVGYLRKVRPDFVVNAAGYTGRPNVDACEDARADTLQGNVLFPQMLAHACTATGTPWGHVSSGCIYTGAKLTGEDGTQRVETDLSKPEVRELIRKKPGALVGFSELDTPNFTFRCPPCSFYSGTKALGEEALANSGQSYIWRLRIPFDEFDNPRNYLTKVQTYSKVYDNVNSLSHRRDFVCACLDLWDRKAPFGIYNVTNPGYVDTRSVVDKIQRILKPRREFEYWKNDEEFYRIAARAPRSNCVLDVSKLLATGVTIRPAEEALWASLISWEPAGKPSAPAIAAFEQEALEEPVVSD